MADNNEYGWGLSRNLPILIILLIILGFLVANVITFNDIAVAPEDPNQTITKSRASYLYWFNLIILLFVLTIIILLVMFMWRNKNTPNVDYFGKNITIIDTTKGKEIKAAKDNYKKNNSLEEIVKNDTNAVPINQKILNIVGSPEFNHAKVLVRPPAAGPVGDFDCVEAGINNAETCNEIKDSINNPEGYCNQIGVTSIRGCLKVSESIRGSSVSKFVPTIIPDFGSATEDCAAAGITNTDTCNIVTESVMYNDGICNQKNIYNIGECYQKEFNILPKDDFVTPPAAPAFASQSAAARAAFARSRTGALERAAALDRAKAARAAAAAARPDPLTVADCAAARADGININDFACGRILEAINKDDGYCKTKNLTNIKDCYNELYESI